MITGILMAPEELLVFAVGLFSIVNLFANIGAAAADCIQQTCNGWTFWQYERAPGDWVPLKDLR